MRARRRWRLTMVLVPVLFGLAGAAALPAQTLVGHVVAAETDAPLAGVFVTLTDSAGARVAALLTRTDGRFVARAPAAGAYVLRLEMIGYRSLSERVRLQSDETLTRTLRLPLEAVRLDEIVGTASRERECSLRAAEGDALARLWEAARQGLQLAEWSAETGWLRASGHTYQRVLDLADLEVLAQTVQPVRRVEPNAFNAPDPESVRASGFVRTTGDGGAIYHGADAALLLSDAFLDTHCFRLRERPDDRLVGLAFEPAPGRNVIDIEGVLWLEAQTARLHSLEYEYTDYPVRAPVPRSRFGGITEFRHLPGGGVAVQRWRIRMPSLTNWANLEAMQRVRRCGREACDDGETIRHLARAGLAIEEEGGVVSSYRLGDGTTLPAADQAAIAGSVTDSTAGGPPEPLPGAEVYIVGTNHRAVTDDRGRFRLDNLPAGTYRVHFDHPKVAELGIARPAAVVTEATAGHVASAHLALPSRATLALGRCGAPGNDGARSREVVVVFGTVRDEHTGAPLRGARVRLHAAGPGAGGQDARAPAGQAAGEPDGDGVVAEQETDAAGRYLFCHAPARLLRVAATFLGQGEAVRWVEARPGAPAEADLELVLPRARDRTRRPGRPASPPSHSTSRRHTPAGGATTHEDPDRSPGPGLRFPRYRGIR